jgi:hypothetical protein
MPKLCRARLTLPSADGQHTVIFECNLGKGHSTDTRPDVHVEVGKVRGLDGKVRAYRVEFGEAFETTEVWRDAKAVPPTFVANLSSNE